MVFKRTTRPRRVMRRRGYGATSYGRSLNRRTPRRIGLLKQLIPNSTHMFKRMGVQVPLAILWNSASSTPYIKNPGLPISGGSGYINGWRLSDGTGFKYFGSDGAGLVPTVPNQTLSVLVAASTGMPNCYQFGGSAFFTLQHLQQYTDFTSLFDQYKIVGIKLDIRFHHNVATYGSAPTIPTIYYNIDYDDFSTPTDKNTLLQHEGSRQRLLTDKTLSIKWRPNTLQNVLTDSVSSAVAIRRGGFNNCNDAQINYVGFKFWVDNLYMASTGNQLLLDITPSFILAFKDTV